HLPLHHLEVERHLADAVRDGLVEVLERGHPEGVLTGHPGTDVPADLAVTSLPEQDPAGRGDAEPDVVHVHGGTSWLVTGRAGGRESRGAMFGTRQRVGAR